MASYRPLAGCKLFPAVLVSVPGNQVTVPLRGVSCLWREGQRRCLWRVTVPLRGGASCFIMACFDERKTKSVPLRGVRVVSAIVYNISVEWSTVFVQL